MAFLREIGTKLAEYTVEPVIRQVGYVICYKNNIKELQSQVDDLVAARTSMQYSVEAEARKGKEIETGVQNWLTNSERLTMEADKVKAKHLAQTKYLHGFCPNLKLRHRLSRKSTKLVQEVAKLCEKKKSFDNIAYAPLAEVCAIAIQDYEALDSRTSTAKAVINELRNFNTYRIGVYGIGGVGKTTLVKEVYDQLAVTSEKLFEEVVMVLDLKQNPSIERIQNAIAEKLGLELPEIGTSGGRASLISNRIKDKKTLVILDGVWESIDLEAVGLPCMFTLKILLTSRSKLVLAKDMGTQKDFHLELLNKEETWRLFQKMAGEIVENPDIQTIAAKVAEKCGGLPLLIVTVARSLKDSPLHDWKDTFRRLTTFDGKGLEEKTYSAIEWSYDKLNSEELKLVFLLCASLVGIANDVDILDLLRYSMGLGFIKNVDTMEEARDVLNSLLKKLQYSCLLLDTDDKQLVRIHDLVKHVAKHIAARDHHVLSVSYGSELKEWPDKEFCEKCTRISLRKCQTPELPQVLQCPELTMFHLSSVDVDSREIPSNFFKEMKKLKVLDLTNRSIASLPPSLKCLKDLQTLCLDSCTLGDLALVGELHNLKMLSFLYSKFKQLPEEIGNLTHLRLLDLTGCSQLEVISPDVISKLKRLEELRMGNNSFNNWEAGRVGDTKRSNASLEELKYLPRLTALQIHVPDANILPADLFTTSKLERFQICIGSMWKWDDVDEALNALKLKLTTNNELDQGLKMLLKRTQDLYVEGMEGVNDKFFRELDTGGYQQLKHLHVQNNAKLSYTINEKVGFPNLTWLAVSELNGLRFLLSTSMARSLSQLKRLQISGCQIMEEVISIEESNQEIAHNFFPQLQDLELKGLPNLTKLWSTSYVELPNPSYERLQLEDSTATGGICEEVEEIHSKRNLDIVRQHFIFENKVEFPNLKKLSLNGLAKLTTIWNNQLSLGSSKNLETIEIVSCDNLKSVFPASVAKSLPQFWSLKVQNCGVEEIISQEAGVLMAPMFVFTKVSYVRFENLPKLKRFYPGLHDCKWPSLETLAVYDCNEVHIFADGTRELNNLYIPDKQSLFLLEKDSFPNLESLGLDVMENWDSPPLHLFRKLKSLRTYAHTNSSLNSLAQLLGLEKVNGEIHAAGDATFPFLRELYLHGMQKLINLGVDSFGPARLYFPKVEILKLEDCDSLKNLRSSAISFNNLTTLQVSRCKGLNYLISFSMATCLMQLSKLEVGDCEEMIEIVASSGNDDLANEIEFRVLKHLELSNLPSLRGFCSGASIVRFPCLENLSMTSCTQLEGFIFDSTDKSTLGNDIEDANSNENIDTGVVQRFLLNNKVELPRLMSLSLKGLTKLTAIWHNQLSDNSFDGENLNSVEIDSCESLKYIFPAMVAKRLERLSKLIVNKCGVEEIVAIEGEPQTMPKFIFPKVTCVKFTELPNLTSFYPAMHASSWPALQKLEVFGCYKLEIFAGTLASFHGKYESNLSAPIKQTLYTIEKDSFPSLEDLKPSSMEIWNGESSCMHQGVEFPNLKKLSLDGLTKLTTIWNNQLSLGSSKNLETIASVSCDNLKSVCKLIQKLPDLPVIRHNQPVVIYSVSPKVIHASVNEFMSLVQRLTGPTSSTDTMIQTSSTRATELLRRSPGILCPAPDAMPPIQAGYFPRDFNIMETPSSNPALFPPPLFSQLRPQQDEECESLPEQLEWLLSLYFSLFPSEYEFRKDELIWMWIAEGFVENGEGKRMEDIGSVYFNSLYKAGFLVLSRYDSKVAFDSVYSVPIYNPGNLLYKVNPIKLLELGNTAAPVVCFKTVNGKLDGDWEMTQYLSWNCKGVDEMNFQVLKNFRHLRTLILSGCGSSIKHVPHDLFLILKDLRTLNLSQTLVSELPNSIRHVKSLRYLDLSSTHITRLPDSIDSLHYLQTIKLRGCVHFHQLPKGMKKLISLRHIDLDIIGQLPSMPPYLGNLTSLQTLSAFVVGREDGCRIRELKNLNDLRGVLRISRLENVSNKEEAEEAALIDKKCLQRLELRWSNVFTEKKEEQEKILECLQPHSGLKELQIHHYAGSALPTWISNPSFSELVVLTLYRCRNCELLPSIGKLPMLRSLSIIEMNEVKEINHQFLGVYRAFHPFPKLEILEIDTMLNLKEWKQVNLGDFPSLLKITVDTCPQLYSLPPLLSFIKTLKHLEIRRCPKLLSLPRKGLPTSLKSFILIDCPELKERCRMAEDWRKIYHVPNIWFDCEEVRPQSHSGTGTSAEISEESMELDTSTLCSSPI